MISGLHAKICVAFLIANAILQNWQKSLIHVLKAGSAQSLIFHEPTVVGRAFEPEPRLDKPLIPSTSPHPALKNKNNEK